MCLNPGKLIVVDYYAVWCGPCVKISPTFVELCWEYPDAIFVKINVDKFQMTARYYKVTKLPTFQFFRNSVLVDTHIGGDPRALREAVRRNQGSQAQTLSSPQPQPQPQPYRHFPHRTFMSFDVIKQLPKIQKRIIETSRNLTGDDARLALTEDEIKNLTKTIETLSNTAAYNTSRFEDAEFLTMLKIIQWSPEHNMAPLDLLRMLVLHPHAADHYARSFREGKDDSVYEICLSFLVDPSLPPNNTFMIWRFLSNLFKDENLRNSTVLSDTDQVLALAAQYISSENNKIKFGVVTTLLNLAVVASKPDYQQLKKPIVSSLLNNMSSDLDTFYRAILAIGTCAYQDTPLILEEIISHVEKFKVPELEYNAQDAQKELHKKLTEVTNEFQELLSNALQEI